MSSTFNIKGRRSIRTLTTSISSTDRNVESEENDKNTCITETSSEDEDNTYMKNSSYAIENSSPNTTTASMEKTIFADDSKISSFFIKVIVLAITVCILSLYIGNTAYWKKSGSFKRTCSFAELSARQPVQSADFWQTLTIGMEIILNNISEMPGVYLFLHQAEDSADILVNEIAAQASRCFGYRNMTVHLDISDFTSEQAIKDYGYIIKRYKEKIKDGKVILIVNLNEIPAKSALALHTICDTYNPIASDVIIFLTLISPNVSINENPTQLARDALFDLWNTKLKDNELDALITRIVDQVITLQT